LQLLDNGKLVPAGNVTIPPNCPIPAVDQVVECRYLYAFKESGCIYQPVYLGVAGIAVLILALVNKTSPAEMQNFALNHRPRVEKLALFRYQHGTADDRVKLSEADFVILVTGSHDHRDR